MGNEDALPSDLQSLKEELEKQFGVLSNDDIRPWAEEQWKLNGGDKNQTQEQMRADWQLGGFLALALGKAAKIKPI